MLDKFQVLKKKNGEGKGKQSAESILWGYIAREICFLDGGKHVLRGSITFITRNTQKQGKKAAKVYLCDYTP